MLARFRRVPMSPVFFAQAKECSPVLVCPQHNSSVRFHPEIYPGQSSSVVVVLEG